MPARPTAPVGAAARERPGVHVLEALLDGLTDLDRAAGHPATGVPTRPAVAHPATHARLPFAAGVRRRARPVVRPLVALAAASGVATGAALLLG